MTIKEKLNKLLAAKQEQRNALNKSMIECDDKDQRAAMGETLSKLSEEIREVEDMLKEINEPADDPNAAGGDPAGDARGAGVVAGMQMRNGVDHKALEARAKKLVESGNVTISNADARAVLVSSGKIATPTEVNGINDMVGAGVSSVVDMVNVVDASGMGAYKVAYQKTNAEAATTEEGADYHESDPEFGFVEITPQTETVISYISKQTRKQSPLTYAAKVNASALTGLRKRAAKIIVDKTLASELVIAKNGIALDEKFLRTVALSYGGDESVVGAAVLQIAKADLLTLGDVRGSDKKPVYEITPDAANPNVGIIKDGGLSVAYSINSNLNGKGKQIYGQLKNFELALFSDYEINVSDDFKFNKGLLAIAGDVQLGGDVTAMGGFVVAAQAAG